MLGCLALIALGVAAWPRSAAALSLAPAVLEFDLSGSPVPDQSVRVTNDGSDETIVLDVQVSQMVYDKAGQPRILRSGSGSLTGPPVAIQPTTAQLAPGEHVDIQLRVVSAIAALIPDQVVAIEVIARPITPAGVAGSTGLEVEGSLVATIYLEHRTNPIGRASYVVSRFTATPSRSLRGPTQLTLVLTNDGDVTVRPQGVVRFRNRLLGRAIDSPSPVNAERAVIPPSAERSFTLSWDSDRWWRFGWIRATAELSDQRGGTQERSVDFWYLPWPVGLGILGLLAGATRIAWFMLARRRAAVRRA